ncbi:hypothetical protein BH10PAT1_BH10PAT1_0430 [soil metagenome]
MNLERNFTFKTIETLVGESVGLCLFVKAVNELLSQDYINGTSSLLISYIAIDFSIKSFKSSRRLGTPKESIDSSK